MHWNCPHCGTQLAIADEKVNTSWSFSRCYHCAGYALVRKSEVNIIKVDRAPAGEKVILPESSGPSTSAGMSMSTIVERSIVKPATRRSTSSGLLNPLRSEATRPLAQPESRVPAAQPFAPLSPLTPPSDASTRPPMAGPNAPAGATADRTAMLYLNGVNGQGAFPDPLPEVPVPSGRIAVLPMAIGVAAAFALGSGLYLLAQTGAIFEKARASREPARSSVYSSTDTVPSPPIAPVAPKQDMTVAEAAAQAKPKSETVVAQANVTSQKVYSDQVQSRAMAPDRQQQIAQPAPTAPHPVQLSSENPPLIVRPKVKNTHLRAGPGMVYPVVGSADENAKYIVTDWSDRWFKVLPHTAPKGNGSNEIAGWIRTDTVQIVPGETATN